MVAIYESKQNSSGRKIKFKAIKYIKNNKNHQKLEASASSITFLHVLDVWIHAQRVSLICFQYILFN